MDMARLDRSGAVPLVGPTGRSLREAPVPPPPHGERPLREEPVGTDLALFFKALPGEDHTTTHELLMTLQEVLGEQAVPLTDRPRPDQNGPEAPACDLLPLDLLHFTAATPLPPADDGPGADETDATALPEPPPIRGPASRSPRAGGPDDHDPQDHHKVRSEGSFARGLVFGVPLSAALWSGIVAAVRWLVGR